MLLQQNKVDLENNQEMEQENAVKLPWINLSLAPCCAEMPAMALLSHTAHQSAVGAGSRQALSLTQMVSSAFLPQPQPFGAAGTSGPCLVGSSFCC